MKKNYYIGIGLIILLIGIITYIVFNDDNSSTLKEVVYKGDDLLISIDGVSSNTLPTSGNYYLVNYDCKNKNTVLSWDSSNHKLKVTNGTDKAGVACYLEFKSNPKLSEMPVGSYVAYVGKSGFVGGECVACQNNGPASSSIDDAETETPNSCLGQNAREDIDTNGNTYGYCYSKNYKYYTTGWRIAYIDSNSKPVIISAGSPECNIREKSTANVTYIKMANTKAMKYCNSDYVDGDCSCLDSDGDGYCDCTDSDSNGLCDEIENGTVDAWAISDLDFYYMTKAISGVGKRLTDESSTLGDSGGILETKNCDVKYSYEECGYNNDLIDNGGYYWFAARDTSSDTLGVIWIPRSRYVDYDDNADAYGLRPIISLSSSVIVTGGSGTMDDPYTISNNSFRINNGDRYINSSRDKSNVILNLVGNSDVTQMCISVGSSVCTNYIDFASTYTLNWSSEADGEKIVYVYYKNASGEIVASMNRSIIIDTISPTNNSVTFVSGDGLFRTLTISSTGANYMCISTTSNNVNDCTDWVNYKTSYDLRFGVGAGSKTAYAFFKDYAGNIAGPHSATTTCTNDCNYKYFMDAYNNSYVYLIRNDGATAMVTTSSSSITWYGEDSQSMDVCGAYNYTNGNNYFWCIGRDNNTYYKSSYNNNSWTRYVTSSGIDTSSYKYSIYPYSSNYAYIVRSDGKTNRISSSGLASTTWSYGYNKDMAACSGYSSSRVICVGINGYYYYLTSYSSTSNYLGGSIIKLTDRTYDNTWIDMYAATYTNIIESDGTSMYTTRFSYNASSATWYTSTIPGGGIKTCASSGYSTYNYCLAEDGYLYYKTYSSTSWTKSSLKYN